MPRCLLFMQLQGPESISGWLLFWGFHLFEEIRYITHSNPQPFVTRTGLTGNSLGSTTSRKVKSFSGPWRKQYSMNLPLYWKNTYMYRHLKAPQYYDAYRWFYTTTNCTTFSYYCIARSIGGDYNVSQITQKLQKMKMVGINLVITCSTM